MMQNVDIITQGSLAKRRDVIPAVFAAAVLGLSILFVIGFVQSSRMHNAAHDTRHAISFPCH
jgi:cobalt transporter subunit CbtB